MDAWTTNSKTCLIKHKPGQTQTECHCTVIIDAKMKACGIWIPTESR